MLEIRCCQENYLPVGRLYQIDVQVTREQRKEARSTDVSAIELQA